MVNKGEKTIRQRLEEAESKYRLLADNLVDAIWVIEVPSLRYLYISPSVEDLRGYTSEEVMQCTIEDFLPPESVSILKAALDEELVNYQRGIKRKRQFELPMKHKDGHLIWVEIIAKLFEEDGSLRIVGVSRDIDSRKKLQLQREDLIIELGKALEEQKRLQRENRILRGLLPICAQCKRIRDENGVWHDLEEYIEQHSEATFTHTVCPDCKQILYPELSKQ